MMPKWLKLARFGPENLHTQHLQSFDVSLASKIYHWSRLQDYVSSIIKAKTHRVLLYVYSFVYILTDFKNETFG